ncbi:contractile injection system tape measure protein [Flavobacterium sp. N3904]|uniref:contractile injection system tape measure protein n=1 Tax=Flavobacterium sp. N3904 TaxID=2986835 RepID=UPI00222473F9|nr:contractile injection system tape measure protein [Flavobacterium sp. N3904]
MHLIQQHTLDISCASTDFGIEVQSVVTELMEKEFYPKVELLLNLYSFQDYTWKIDKLEIELPPLSRKKWKEEIVAHSLEQIESYLKLHFENLEKNQSVIESLEILFSKETITENLFFDFLKKGSIPENALFRTLEELIVHLEINASFIDKLKALFLENPVSLIRFIYAFPESFKTKIENQIDAFQIEFKELLQFVLISKANYFSNIALDSWVEFIAWQFYFYKEKKVSRTVVHETVQTLSSLHWDIKISLFLTLKELLNPEISIYKNNLLAINNDFIAFWELVLVDFNPENLVEESTSEEKNRTELNQKNELETSNSKIKNMIYVENAGLILFHPFLKSLFEQLELTKNEIWNNKMSQHKAILLTQFLIKGETRIGENELVLNKILCGFPIENVVNTQLEITQKEIEKCESLLQAVIEHWKILGDTSVAGLRETFLQREGKIIFTENEKLELWVKQEGVDILLAQLPWGIEMIKTPWMEDFLQCYWN